MDLGKICYGEVAITCCGDWQVTNLLLGNWCNGFWPLQYRPAMHGDWSFVPKLFLGFMNLSNELYESFAGGLQCAVFRPVAEMKLSNCSRLSVLSTASQTEAFTYSLFIHSFIHSFMEPF